MQVTGKQFEKVIAVAVLVYAINKESVHRQSLMLLSIIVTANFALTQLEKQPRTTFNLFRIY